MLHSPTSYIDGVPVKISEKYKPPPKISLPQKIVHCLAHCSATTESDQTNRGLSDQYDFQLERQTQITLASWKNVRQQDRFVRKERIRQRAIERQRLQDEHQKKMLTAVSYPNAEDLSSDDEESQETPPEETQSAVASVGIERKAHVYSDSEAIQNALSTESATIGSTNIQESKPRFDTILIPTIMACQAQPDSNWSFTSKIANVGNLSAEITNRYTSPSAAAKINYSDFENDTSSPFDNVELKTIDELDILAQVLKQNYISTQTESSSDHVLEEKHISQNENNPTSARHHTEPNPCAEVNQFSRNPSQVSAAYDDNAINSNGEGSRPQQIINHSNVYYTAGPNAYASNYVYENQNQLAYSVSPTSPHQIHTNHMPTQHVYFNYPTQTHVGYNPNEAQNTSCNERYAAAYGVHVSRHSPTMAPDATRNAAIKTNSVPDILRQLKTSSGNALH